jgi:hypothetical protein
MSVPRSSAVRYRNVSLPAPPVRVSTPVEPFIVSLPAPPEIVSARADPVRTSGAAPPVITGVTPVVTFADVYVIILVDPVTSLASIVTTAVEPVDVRFNPALPVILTAVAFAATNVDVCTAVWLATTVSASVEVILTVSTPADVTEPNAVFPVLVNTKFTTSVVPVASASVNVNPLVLVLFLGYRWRRRKAT